LSDQNVMVYSYLAGAILVDGEEREMQKEKAT
jgi:hypothetical protein